MILLVTVIAAIVRVAVWVVTGFDGLYGQDPFAYWNQAVAIAEGLPRGTGPPGDFFWPNGYPALVAVSVWVFGAVPLAAQLVSFCSGVALAPLTYALARQLDPTSHRWGALVAGLSVATAGQCVLSSILVMSDVPALFWATLGAWCLARGAGGPAGGRLLGGRWMLACGAALGLAIVTRWIYALLLPVFVVAILLSSRARVRRTSSLLVAAAVIVVPQVLSGSSASDNLFGRGLAAGWSPANAIERRFETHDGLLSFDWPNAVFYLQPAGHPAFLFPVLGGFALVGLVLLLRRRARLPLGLLGGWLAVAYGFLVGLPNQNFRFGLTLLVPLAVLAGIGVGSVAPISSRARRSTPWRRPALVAAALLVFGFTAAWAVRMSTAFASRHEIDRRIARDVAAHVDVGTTVLAFGITATLRYEAPDLDVRELHALDTGDLADLLAQLGPVALVVAPEVVRSAQWSDRSPGVNVRWLESQAELGLAERFGPYVVQRIVR